MAKNSSRSYSPPDKLENLNACVSSPSPQPRSFQQKDATFREWVVQNQIGISLTTLSTLLAAHTLYPSVQSFTAPFFQMSYYHPESGKYKQGWDDVYFVISAVFAFTAVRGICLEWIFTPLGRYAGMKRKASVRFAEQAWLVCYDLTYWSYGMYLWSNSSYWGDFKVIWAEWPKQEVAGEMKWYLLTQLAFWIQQIFTVNIEERRKDFYHMLSHHVLTSSLLSAAYIYRFYNVANVVLSLMDIVDFLLPAAKILKYFGYETMCNTVFVLLILTWLVTRHILYPMLCWSIYQNVPEVMSYGCYNGKTAQLYTTNGYPNRFAYMFGPYLSEEGPFCMNFTIKWIFLSLLLAIQVLSILWFGMILRVAINAVRSGSAEDSRSDDEDEGEEEDEDVETSVNPSNESLGRATADKASGSEGSWRRANAPAPTRRGHGGILGDSDRKALLGRIGCDKPTHD
ncbi:hypothetical protein TMatcc_003775 [Talaromyces marneffei ATCC 18224]|uniref:Longevity-assurance protein (LAC1), putative n=1 Tax=Talaromyces marneffei (strain ATCC 18224 / CBS 334.59 / QM 7333) TaxID=441960 RepID=B6Q242_TALMQ|nr:uncharacterized protein EYB26_001220 [Talaromyces marneffei]EEA27924.1 longevity-assurance protein (LAC1), putative [Talaromyces marneffei ATCC 18224]KAE8556412.1 hypothetical protein EYB25_001113 [Talaromyces marneffei]QGA13570.1 hypothetical protein EYB26_001220 [Talaromyces marneffei]